jgi:hypothetical protein
MIRSVSVGPKTVHFDLLNKMAAARFSANHSSAVVFFRDTFPSTRLPPLLRSLTRQTRQASALLLDCSFHFGQIRGWNGQRPRKTASKF